MIYTIVPFVDPNSAMKMWSPLASYGKLVRFQGNKNTLFYYDTAIEHPASFSNGDRSGKPALILVHGLGDEADSWRHLIPLLSPHYRVVALDLPGFGRSKVSGPINLRRHIQAVHALVEALGPAVLVGNSMGAVVAEAAAFERPELVKRLILLDGCFPMSGKPDIQLFLLALPLLGRNWYRSFRNDRERAYQSLFGYYADFQGLSPEDQQFLRERIIARVESNTQEQAYFSSLRSLLLANVLAVPYFVKNIRSFPGKILILWGEKDQVLLPHTAERLRTIRPDARYHIIPGAGHLPHQEKPRETAELILEFLH